MKWFTNLFWTRWKVIRTIWPYPEGYAIYRRNRWTGQVVSLDHGSSKEEAQASAREQNR